MSNAVSREGSNAWNQWGRIAFLAPCASSAVKFSFYECGEEATR
jgi:hypothetical protein